MTAAVFSAVNAATSVLLHLYTLSVRTKRFDVISALGFIHKKVINERVRMRRSKRSKIVRTFECT